MYYYVEQIIKFELKKELSFCPKYFNLQRDRIKKELQNIYFSTSKYYSVALELLV